MRFPVFGVVLIFALRNATAWADEETMMETQALPFFKTELATREISLGRPFEMCVIARHRKSTRIVWPATLELGDAFETGARRQKSNVLEADLMRSELCYQLTIFDTAIDSVPAIAIAYDLGTGEPLVRESAARAVRVLEQISGDNPSLRAPAELVSVPVRDWRVLALFGALAVAFALATARWLWRRRPAQVATDLVSEERLDVLSPHEEALAKLSALESRGALDVEELKPCYLEMSEILRSYLGRRFEFSALDLTTAEIRSRLASVAGAEEWLKTVVGWLSRCDLVKYANSVADPDEAREALYAARVLIDRTKKLDHDRPREIARA